MNFMSQVQSIDELKILANHNSHSIIISGPEGCGKTYLASVYKKFLDVEDFQVVSPTVSDIRNLVESVVGLTNKLVICIENLDQGVMSASYSLLKFLEEPQSNVYIIVTARNMNKIPDTILSRSVTVLVSSPRPNDIVEYAKSVNQQAYNMVSRYSVWRCIKTFKDVERVLVMSQSQLEHFTSLQDILKCNDSVSNLVWKLSHYEDNTECPLDLVLRHIITSSNSQHIKKSGIECINDLSQGRIAKHMVLTKFVFESKYVE